MKKRKQPYGTIYEAGLGHQNVEVPSCSVAKGWQKGAQTEGRRVTSLQLPQKRACPSKCRVPETDTGTTA